MHSRPVQLPPAQCAPRRPAARPPLTKLLVQPINQQQRPIGCLTSMLQREPVPVEGREKMLLGLEGVGSLGSSRTASLKKRRSGTTAAPCAAGTMRLAWANSRRSAGLCPLPHHLTSALRAQKRITCTVEGTALVSEVCDVWHAPRPRSHLVGGATLGDAISVESCRTYCRFEKKSWVRRTQSPKCVWGKSEARPKYVCDNAQSSRRVLLEQTRRNH